jgi:diadenosine tetraphosphate (Ap4A) HIT family hydrolase
MNAGFSQKFKLDELLIKKVGSWTISLRPVQPTIGSLVLSLDRTCEKLSQLSNQESIDMGVAFKEIEGLLEKTFIPDKINYLALMMIDNQVHFHVIPRYSSPVKLEDRFYKDKNWPGIPSLDTIKMSNEELKLILKIFKDVS